MVDERQGRVRRRLQLNAQEQLILDNQLMFTNSVRTPNSTINKLRMMGNVKNEPPESKEQRHRERREKIMKEIQLELNLF